MKLPLDLLEQADHLARRELRRPKQASLRRSTSTACYALFHLLCAEAAAILAPNVSDEARASMQRLITHDSLRIVCGRFLQTPLSTPFGILITSPVSNDLRFIALALLQLQDARHSADYDLNSSWNRVKAST